MKLKKCGNVFLMVCSMLVVLLMPLPASAVDWTIETIESAGDVGKYTSIAMDSNNKVHISYYDDTNGNLKYATNASGSWVTSTIDSLFDVGLSTSIAVDSNNKVHISYLDSSGWHLKYATNASGVWVTTTLDSSPEVGDYSSIAVDKNNKVHISYRGQDYMHPVALAYVTNMAGTWVTSVVDNEGSAGWFTSIAVDSNNKVHISYYDYQNAVLRYATNAEGSWSTTTVDSDVYAGFPCTSIAVDSNNKAHISYARRIPSYSGYNYHLRYATNASGVWVIATLDGDGNVGSQNSISVDSNNKVHIGYYDITNRDLKYVTNAAGSWVISTVDHEGDVGAYNSITVDSNNRLHISYYDGSNGDLKYATNACLPLVANAGQSQTVEQTSSAGASVTLDGSGSTGGCEVLIYEWTWPGESATGVSPTVLMPPGTTMATLTVGSGTGSATATVDITVRDTQKPVTLAMVTATPGSNGWYISPVAVTLTATDTGSGVRGMRYQINNGAWTEVSGFTAAISLTTDSTYDLAYYAVDNANNAETAQNLTVKIDTTAPAIAALASPPANASGWNNTDVTVTFLCADSLSGAAACTAPVTVASEGIGLSVSGAATDHAGLMASMVVTLNIDKTSPAITVSGVQDSATYELGLVPTPMYSVTDAPSGVATASAVLTGGDGMGLGMFTYTVTATDHAGNNATSAVSYTVISTPTGAAALINQLADTGAITANTEAVLTTMLNSIQNAPNQQAQANKVKALINHITAMTGKTITREAAALLINAAQQIITH